MKISIEFKNGKYTITYGKLVATAASIKEAVDDLEAQFRAQLDKFFIQQ